MGKWQNFSGARGFDGGLYQSGFPASDGRAVVRQGNGVVLGVDGAACQNSEVDPEEKIIYVVLTTSL